MVMVRNRELEIREELVSIHHPGVLVVARDSTMEMGVIGAMIIGKGIKYQE